MAALLERLDQGMKPKDAITKRKRREADYTSSKQVTAWGVEKPIAAWGRDRRAKVGAFSIRKRLKAGWSAEQAISTGAFDRVRGQVPADRSLVTWLLSRRWRAYAATCPSSLVP